MAERIWNPRRINKDLPVPYYYQIVQILRESIADIDKKESHIEITLPSETELCDLFAVNRGTIRYALDMLEREGLIYREKGRGTFVRRRRVELDLSYLCSTTDDLRSRGWEPATEVISITQVTPRSHIRVSLNLNEDEKIWEVYRRRLANGEPISLQRAFFSESLMPDLIKNDLTGSILYIVEGTLSNSTKLRRSKLSAHVLATSEEAELLLISGMRSYF